MNNKSEEDATYVYNKFFYVYEHKIKCMYIWVLVVNGTSVIVWYNYHAESCLSGRAYIGEVLIQIWLKIHEEILDKQVCVLNECFK